MLSVPSALTNPCDARLTPSPPMGCPRFVLSRMKLIRNSLTIVAPKLFVSPNVKSCARPVVAAEKPGTLAPLCATG